MALRRPAGQAHPRAELVALHRAIYRRQRREIAASVQDYTSTFRAYEAGYQRRVRAYRDVIGYEEALRRARRADVIYVGDYHTLKQAQKAYLKLVQRALGYGRPVALALEFVQGAHQPALDAFLRGRITERTFLSRIDYPGHHVFPIWNGFKPILEAARDFDLPVLAIDLAGARASLTQRDRYAGARIAAFRASHPRHQLFVLTGQLHVAPDHLPREVAMATARLQAPAPAPLTVYQNCEEIFWTLTSLGLEHEVEAVEIGDTEISLFNTSPVIAQQSYLNHLHADEPLDDGLESAPERTFKDMCRVLASFLDVDLQDSLEGVSVYSLGDLSFFEDLESRGTFSRRELAYMKRQVLASESYYIPRAQTVYLANLSVNHAAEEAAHWLRHLLTDDDGDRHGLVDAFYARVLNEALAFFGSKVINHRRACLHQRELAALVAAWDGGDRTGRYAGEVAAARVVLAHLRLERGERVPGLREIYEVHSPDLFNSVTHLLGYILGDKLYYGMLRGKIPKQEIRELFTDPLDEEGAAFHTYFYLSSAVGNTRIPRRV